MTTGATGQLGLALPVQGELSGTWGDTVNNGITQYTNIAIAATLTLTNDGAVTLANTTGDASASNIVSTLTGAGTVTAQFAIVRVTGTLTVAKVVTAPSYSKTYTVVNAATGGIVTFKAAGQTGVSIAVGESAFVYYNGTDYVKVSSTVATGVTSFTAGTTGLTPNTATTGAVTLAGTLGTANGGTNLTSFTSGGAVYATSTSALTTGTLPTTAGGTNLTSFTSGGVVYASSTSALATGSGLVFNGTNLGVGTASPTDTFGFSKALDVNGSSGAFVYVRNNGSATNVGGIGYSGSDLYISNQAAGNLRFFCNNSAAERARITAAGGFVVGTTTDPGVGIIADANGNVRTVPQSGAAKTTSYTLAVGDIGEFIQLGASGAIVIPDATFTTGDVVSIFNNTGSTATITCSITTAYIAGTYTDKATMTLAAAGVATVLFITSTLCVVSGNVT